MSPTTSTSELKRRIDAVVCPLCTECRSDGTCGLERVEDCPIGTHLDQLVYIAVTVDSPRMDEYVAAVRQEICTGCKLREKPADRCEVRREGHCALDTFLMPALDVIEDFVGEAEARALRAAS